MRLSALLAGAQGLVETNKRLKADPGLQRAFGRTGCAEQSVVQDTLDACTSENVEQMQAAMEAILQRHSQSYQHDYQLNWQVLDADMTGRPCGKKANFASKGYFAKQRNRRGRQEGYVIGTWYQEIIVEQLFAGTTQLNKALPGLIEQSTGPGTGRTQTRAHHSAHQLRGGSVEHQLAPGPGLSGACQGLFRCAGQSLRQSVSEWIIDPNDSRRQIGWVTVEPELYGRPVQRIAVRCRKRTVSGVMA